MSVTVTLEFTPNPDTLKYAVSQPLLDRAAAYEFNDASETKGAPLAEALFRIPGVKGVMIAKDFVTVAVTGQDVLGEVNAAAIKEIPTHLSAGLPVVTDEYEAAADHGGDDSDVSNQIKAILDEHVRPAVARDGGDIVLDRFENGIAYMQLKGSCQGCPSSTATLKMGIENMLRELVPEVQQVEAV